MATVEALEARVARGLRPTLRFRAAHRARFIGAGAGALDALVQSRRVRPLIAALVVLLLALGCGEDTRTRLRARLGDADAQLALAEQLANGAEGARDTAGAVLWYRKAAEQGRGEAQLALAKLLESESALALEPGEVAALAARGS